MMLSRVAERLYWMGRYLERTEDTARLIRAYTHLILDIPRGTEPGWHVLLATLDVDTEFEQHFRRISERNVVKFLLDDKRNPSSIRSSVALARENVRTTRDALPAQAWELMNEMYIQVNEEAESSIARRSRFDFLDRLIARNQQLNGLIDTSASRDHALWFMQLGQYIERADMTSRVLDVAIAAIRERSQSRAESLPLLWTNFLESLSSRSAYRRESGPIIKPDEAVRFVLSSHRSPRSIVFCVNQIEEIIGQLKAPAGMFRQIRGLERGVKRFLAAPRDEDALHLYIDTLQIELADIGQAIHESWFSQES